MLVRLLALLLGIAAICGGVAWSGGPYGDAIAFRHAPDCPQLSRARDCIGSESGTIVGTDTYETTGTSSGTEPPDPPVTHYQVKVRRASGATVSYDVGFEFYQAAGKNTPVQLRLWRGDVVGLSFGGHSQRLQPPSEGTLFWTLALAWAGVGMVLWSAIGDGRPYGLVGIAGFRVAGWMFIWLANQWVLDTIVLGDPFSWFDVVFSIFGTAIGLVFVVTATDGFPRFRRRRSASPGPRDRWRKRHW
jgi:hypothetical protein